MTLKEKIQGDLLAAVKKKEEFQPSVLRLLLAAILNKEKEKRYKLSQEKKEFKEEELEKESQLIDGETTEVISFEIKKKKEAIFFFEKGKREDLAEKEKKAVEIFQTYLPEQLSEGEIEKLAEAAIKKAGAKDIKDMGKVMSGLMPELKGRADGSSVSKIVKDLLVG